MELTQCILLHQRKKAIPKAQEMVLVTALLSALQAPLLPEINGDRC